MCGGGGWVIVCVYGSGNSRSSVVMYTVATVVVVGWCLHKCVRVVVVGWFWYICDLGSSDGGVVMYECGWVVMVVWWWCANVVGVVAVVWW